MIYSQQITYISKDSPTIQKLFDRGILNPESEFKLDQSLDGIDFLSFNLENL
jgi:hypothetical protein